jgi:hypothetical protein
MDMTCPYHVKCNRHERVGKLLQHLFCVGKLYECTIIVRAQDIDDEKRPADFSESNWITTHQLRLLVLEADKLHPQPPGFPPLCEDIRKGKCGLTKMIQSNLTFCPIVKRKLSFCSRRVRAAGMKHLGVLYLGPKETLVERQLKRQLKYRSRDRKFLSWKDPWPNCECGCKDIPFDLFCTGERLVRVRVHM